MSATPNWRDPKRNVMGQLFDYNIWKTSQKVGCPARKTKKVTREFMGFDELSHVQLDIGGEGYHEESGIVSGFNSAININEQTTDSQPPKCNIPHLVRVTWGGSFVPFVPRFANYITTQGTPLPPDNIAEIVRCARPGGQIALWVNDDSGVEEIASELMSYAEYDPWDEFSVAAGFEKVVIPVPGPTYMFAFSMENRCFFIQHVTSSGKLGAETDRGSWNFTYNTLTTYKIAARTFTFGWSKKKNYYFIQELLPNGKLGRETATGKFNFDYDIMKAMQIGGGTYLFGFSRNYSYVFVQELLEGGKLGVETVTMTDAHYDQMLPFRYGSKTYVFFFANDNTWRIYEFFRSSYRETARGKWNNYYNHTIVVVKGKPILFGSRSDGYWFTQPFTSGGEMGNETDNGTWGFHYATLSSYEYGNRSFLFGQNSKGTRNWFIQEVFENGKMGVETDHENWGFAYETVDFYTQYA